MRLLSDFLAVFGFAGKKKSETQYTRLGQAIVTCSQEQLPLRGRIGPSWVPWWVDGGYVHVATFGVKNQDRNLKLNNK